MDQMRGGAGMQPIVAGERIASLDVLRGFALLGILLMNIEGFVGPLMAALGGIDPTLTGADWWADAAIYILVQGKFYALFSLLFGMGFAVLLDRAMDAGVGGGWLYLRRLLVLLLIGTVHAVLIWAGDILMVYAAMGFVLLLFFRRTPASRLRWWGVGLFLVPIALTWLFALSIEAMRSDPEAAAAVAEALAAQGDGFAALIEQQRQAYGPDGSYGETVATNIEVVRQMFGSYLPFFGPTVLGYFLIGAWFIRSGLMRDPAAHLGTFRRLALVGLPLGLALVLLGAWMMPEADMGRMDLAAAISTTATMVGSALMALGYLGGVVVLVHDGRWGGRMAVLAPVGRMALSNYLAQSIICTLVFYGYGLGLFEQLPRLWQVPFVFALFALQVAWSHWWMARFRFGPAEWLWRSLSYLRPQPMRR